jgi:hypothetical protein
MLRTWKVGRHLMGPGVLMLCLGTALYSLASLMTNPMLDELGYTMAVALTALCLLITGVYLGVRANRARHFRQVAIYLLVGEFSIACWVIFWLIQSAPLDIRLLVLLAGLHGLFWGLWYVRLAFHFQAYRRKSVVLFVLAGTTSSLGIILATQSPLSKISAVTAVACYAMFLGVQILLTSVFLYRDCDTSGELLAGDSPKRNELNTAGDSTVLPEYKACLRF